MKYKNKILALLLCMIVFCSMFSLTVSAASVGTYIYNGVTLAELPAETDGKNNVIVLTPYGNYYLQSTTYQIYANYDTGYGEPRYMVPWGRATYYKFENGGWVETTTTEGRMTDYVWSDFEILALDSTAPFIWPAMEIVILKPIGFDDFSDVASSLGEQIKAMTIVDVLAVAATAVVGIVFMWWGVRKLARAILKVAKKGKVTV